MYFVLFTVFKALILCDSQAFYYFIPFPTPCLFSLYFCFFSCLNRWFWLRIPYGPPHFVESFVHKMIYTVRHMLYYIDYKYKCKGSWSCHHKFPYISPIYLKASAALYQNIVELFYDAKIYTMSQKSADVMIVHPQFIKALKRSYVTHFIFIIEFFLLIIQFTYYLCCFHTKIPKVIQRL